MARGARDVEVVRVEDVTKSFTLRKQKSVKESIINASRANMSNETFNALTDVSLTIRAGESVGLVGPNGSGKSTLLKIIGGILTPNSGRVLLRGRLAALLELGAGFHPDLTGRENIYLNASVLGLTRAETDKYFDDIVEFSGIPDFIDTQVKFYSSGMYVRLAFSVAVHVDPDILLVDEVLAVGDEVFQQKCMNKIREFQEEGRTIVLVSHSAGQVADVCERAIVLQKGRVIEDAESRIALGRLRKDYQAVIDKAKLAGRTEISPDQADIVRIYLTDSMHSSSHSDFQVVMPPGSDLVVHCEVDFGTLTKDWSVEASIESTMGGGVLALETRDTMGRTMPDALGVTKFNINFPDLHAGEGEYIVNVAIKDSNGIVIDAMSRAAMFAVRGNKHTTGAVYSDANILFVDPPEPER